MPFRRCGNSICSDAECGYPTPGRLNTLMQIFESRPLAHRLAPSTRSHRMGGVGKRSIGPIPVEIKTEAWRSTR
ncbi:hypothetical protein RRG08_017826 [Elysia crispata]|uniref:Uncharacterized protein n=1 Tax=Elysia crispata TaxID=231223 RepID=A0AAE1B8K8_9GAST|nr:hypothetical protein RRG08_017826 [Elysia crispata]